MNGYFFKNVYNEDSMAAKIILLRLVVVQMGC
jgi:hypothetical protein